MKIAVVGSGGVGGFFGGLLAQARHDVAFVARGAHLRAIRTRSLKIERASGGFTIAPANATDDPADIGPVDLALLCVKTYDLAEALALMRPLVGPHTSVLTLQNGGEAPDMAAAAFGAQAVLPGLAYCEVAVQEPGVIFQGSALQRIVLGECDGTHTPRQRDRRRVRRRGRGDELEGKRARRAVGQVLFHLRDGWLHHTGAMLARRAAGRRRGPPIAADRDD